MAPQSRRRRQVQESEDEEEEEERPTQSAQRQAAAPVSDNESDEEPEDGDGMEVDGGADSQDQFVKKLVRYALACEFQRTVIRRTAIAEKVLGNSERGSFKRVFELAQKQLRSKFGMEMVPLPEKEKIDMRAKRNAVKNKKSNTKVAVTSYILVTTLPPAYRIPAIITPSLIGNVEDESAYIAFYTVIISYIAMNPNGQCPDHKLKRMLSRMNAEKNVPGGQTTDAALTRMEKQGYIWKIKENAGEDETIDWRVGPRGKMEIGNRGVKAFVLEVFGEGANEDLEKRLNRSLGVESRVADPDEEQVPPQQANSDPGQGRQSGRRRRAADSDDD